MSQQNNYKEHLLNSPSPSPSPPIFQRETAKMTEKPIQSAEDVLASILAVTIDIEIEEKLSMDNENVNKQDLRESLRETQCPLMPSKYCQSEDFYSAFYFNGEMWRMEDNGCSIIEFKNEALKRKAMDE